jgi:toxin ParE1/3/4
MPRRKLEAHPEVYEEVEYYRFWYESKANKLGFDFLKEIDYALDSIKQSPCTWPWYDKQMGIRKFLVHRFPFGVLYMLKGDVIQIIAVADLRRKPGYWKNRIVFFQ